jgi:hypothetical protein
VLLSSGLAFAQDKPAGIELVKDGKSDYVVVISMDASPSEKWAAKDFVDHIKKMSGAELKIEEANINDNTSLPAKAVCIGWIGMGFIVLPEPLVVGDEGFALETVGTRLIIVGGKLRGTMYGVYTLLEKLGCRWWYPGASTIPQMKNITIPALDEQQAPAMEYRDYLYGDMDDNEPAQLFRARNKLNGGFYKSLKPEYGGVWTFDTLVHSVGRLMPPAKYFKDHPEYFALVNGQRMQSQPCCSSGEAARIMAETLMGEIEKHPEWHFVTVGQDDDHNYCRCDKCQELVKKYGTLGGMQLAFAKEVSKIVHEKYPKVIFNVPAYEWSRKPPTGIKPDDGGFITLCSIECNFGQPLAEGYPKQNADFRDDLVGWSELAPKLLVWDYTTNFSHYILPYPNYYSLAANVKFFADHKVRGYMGQGSHTTKHGQFAPLCTWVLAKALWDPNSDGKKLVEEFCLGYYGPQAGKSVLEYANALYEAIAKDRIPIWCTRGSYLSAPYLSPELMARGDALFRQAEAAVKDNPDLLTRVQTDHVPVLYVIAKRERQIMPAVAKASPGVTLSQVCKEFAQYAKAAGIAAVREGDGAQLLYDWANDYAALKAADPKADLPAELKDADPNTYHFLHAAQMDSRVNSLKKVEGATDGWAMAVTSPGWVIQHSLGSAWDFSAEKSYRVLVRAKATMPADATDTALSVGVYCKPPLKGATKNLKAGDVNGKWQTYDLGVWKPTKDGGTFYVATGKAGVKDAYLDCLWLIETPETAGK